MQPPNNNISSSPIDQILFDNRRVYLYGSIDIDSAIKINKTLKSLDILDNSPIIMEINSGGGSVYAGFSIINTMEGIKSPIVTYINGMAASMAGLISVVGDQRAISQNSWWMAHDLFSGIEDYSNKIIDRSSWIKKEWVNIEKHFKTYTGLGKQDINKARNGELWLSPEETIKKKICDYLIMPDNKSVKIKCVNKVAKVRI